MLQMHLCSGDVIGDPSVIDLAHPKAPQPLWTLVVQGTVYAMFHFTTQAAPSTRKVYFKPSIISPTRNMTSKANKDLKNTMLFDVSHLTAVVTGGGTGIGLMITQALVSNGAKVYITGRRHEALESVVDQYNNGPGKIIA